MPDVPEDTIEAESDYDYSYSTDYDYGVLDEGLQAIANAAATTAANSLAVGTAAATSTASTTTTANAVVQGVGSGSTASATTTATTTATGTASAIAKADTQTSASSTATSAGKTTATASAQSSATSIASDATPEQSEVQWQVTRDGTTVDDAVFDVDPVVDTANPFGDYAVIKIDDTGGQKFEEYERGTRIDAAVSENFGITYENQFTGYVVERRETEQSGADVLEVEAYSFDQFIRRNTVTNDQSGNTISEAFADIIQTDTPVNYNASKVNVGDDQELTRSYQGEPVENVLRDFAFKSNNEEFGVDDDLDAFFRPRETEHIDRGIDNTQWFNYDIPELGKEAINEVEVWFDDGEESVIVDDGTDKLDLQDNLGLPDPGTQRAELQRPLITNVRDAEDIGRKYLAFKNATLSGTVTTYGLFDAEPGDTIGVTIDPRGIDEEFVIAGMEYRWGVDQTILTIVEKRGDVDDILSELNDSVQRNEMEGANRDAPKDRITTTQTRAEVGVAVDADGNTADRTKFVNDGRRAVRDGWRGAGLPSIDTIAVGDDGTALSRSNTSLQNQTNSASASQTLPDSTTVEFSASITQTGVEEIGLFTSGGDLVARATFDSAVDLSGSVTVTLTVSNDTSVSRGVLTNDGQTVVRDVLANNSPAIPTAYAYGSDGTAVAESDTALGNEVVSQQLDNVLLGRIESQADWETATPDFASDEPLTVTNGGTEPLQTTQFIEAENTADAVATDVSEQDVSGFLSNAAGELLQIEGDFVTFEFSFPYDVPSGEAVADTFNTLENFDGTVTFYIDGVQQSSSTFSGTSTENTVDGTGTVNKSFDAGTTHTFTIELTTSNMTAGGGNGWVVDTMQVIDQGDRFGGFNISRSATKDPDVFAFENPQLFPDLQELALETFPTTRNITEGSVESAWNNTDNSQFIELANDGSTFTRTNNAETASATFASPERGLDVRIGISRFSNTPTTTPTTGDGGQRVDTLEAFANPEAIVTDNIGQTLTRIVIPQDTITGQTIREAGLKSNGTLLTRHQLAAFDVLAEQQLTSSETTTFTGTN